MWDKYDRSTSLETMIVREDKTEYIDRKLYFSGFRAEGGTVRCYARFLIPQPSTLNSQTTPVLIALLPKDNDIDRADAQKILQAGYAVLLLDYSGKSDKKSRYTVYPHSINPAWESDPDTIKKPPADPKASCWYYWTTCVLHALTYLENEGYGGRIGLIGIGEGAGPVFKSGLTQGITAGATFFGGDIPDTGDELLAYKAALDSRAYADGCFPILINASSNEKNGALDYLNELYTVSPLSRFSIFANAETAISENQRISVKKWFDYFFYDIGELPHRPELNAFCSEGALYAEMDGDYKDVKIYYAEDRPAFCRNWVRAEVNKIGESKYLARLRVADPSVGILLFAAVTRADGFTLSTQLACKNPQKLGVKADGEKNRVVYRVESAESTWLVQNGGFFETGFLEIKKGPFDLEGICGGELVSFAAGDTRFRGGNESLLQVIINSPTPQDAEFTITVLDSAPVEYKCKKPIMSGGWSTVTLSAEDFKSQKGVPSFNKAVGLAIRGKGVIINSVVWI